MRNQPRHSCRVKYRSSSTSSTISGLIITTLLLLLLVPSNSLAQNQTDVVVDNNKSVDDNESVVNENTLINTGLPVEDGTLPATSGLDVVVQPVNLRVQEEQDDTDYDISVEDDEYGEELDIIYSSDDYSNVHVYISDEDDKGSNIIDTAAEEIEEEADSTFNYTIISSFVTPSLPLATSQNEKLESISSSIVVSPVVTVPNTNKHDAQAATAAAAAITERPDGGDRSEQGREIAASNNDHHNRLLPSPFEEKREESKDSNKKNSVFLNSRIPQHPQNTSSTRISNSHHSGGVDSKSPDRQQSLEQERGSNTNVESIQQQDKLYADDESATTDTSVNTTGTLKNHRISTNMQNNIEANMTDITNSSSIIETVTSQVPWLGDDEDSLLIPLPTNSSSTGPEVGSFFRLDIQFDTPTIAMISCIAGLVLGTIVTSLLCLCCCKFRQKQRNRRKERSIKIESGPRSTKDEWTKPPPGMLAPAKLTRRNNYNEARTYEQLNFSLDAHEKKNLLHSTSSSNGISPACDLPVSPSRTGSGQVKALNTYPPLPELQDNHTNSNHTNSSLISDIPFPQKTSTLRTSAEQQQHHHHHNHVMHHTPRNKSAASTLSTGLTSNSQKHHPNPRRNSDNLSSDNSEQRIGIATYRQIPSSVLTPPDKKVSNGMSNFSKINFSKQPNNFNNSNNTSPEHKLYRDGSTSSTTGFASGGTTTTITGPPVVPLPDDRVTIPAAAVVNL